MPANLYEPGNFHVKGSVEAEGGFTQGGVPVGAAPLRIGEIGSGLLNLTTELQQFPAWGTEIDSGGMVDDSGQPLTLIAPVSGYYLFIAALFSGGAENTITAINGSIQINGAESGSILTAPTASGSWFYNVSEIFQLAAGDRMGIMGSCSGEGAASCLADLTLTYLGS